MSVIFDNHISLVYPHRDIKQLDSQLPITFQINWKVRHYIPTEQCLHKYFMIAKHDILIL